MLRPEPPLSVAPEPVTTTEPADCQDAEPPVTFGGAGAVWSSLTVLAAVADDGAHCDTKPMPSTDRNCTRVTPSALMVAVAPGPAADHVAPLSIDVRYSYEATPLPVS